MYLPFGHSVIVILDTAAVPGNKLSACGQSSPQSRYSPTAEALTVSFITTMSF